MEIKGKRVLVLGGAGLVGMAICRQMFAENPDEMIVASLTEKEAQEACDILRFETKTDVILTAVGGNIFLRDSLQAHSRQQLLNDADERQMLIDDVLGEFNEEVLHRSFLFQLIKRFRPHIIVDCVNSATAVAYQDVFTSYFRLTGHLKNARESKKADNEFISEVERLLCTLYVPQLIRHVQILYEAMRQVKTEYYFKIGTSGTGGMGLNIPYTHSEEKPSRMLLSKSSVAGAHTMLLFLMARTPDAPITKEIKPTAAIAWKKIAYGTIYKHGEPIKIYDCPPESATELQDKIVLKDDKCAIHLTDEKLESVYIDTGENGIFSQGEFEAISLSGQMELITPEEIARNVVFEIKGGNTGHDIINALDNATMGPTYRAGVMRQGALEMMAELQQEHRCESVAFELLGPPRLSKLLYEAQLLKLAVKNLVVLRNTEPKQLTKLLEKIIVENRKLRSSIISIGIPILMPDGKKLLRGPVIKIPPYRGFGAIEVTGENIEKWAY
ncbi:MAG: short-chain dehydrogenase, partial [bacterium]